MTVEQLRQSLHGRANPEIAAHSQRFFKTGPGEYGEGDRFLGIRVPVVRQVARQGRGLLMEEILEFLQSIWHEERLLALVIMVDRYKWADTATREELHRAYIAHTDHVNSWDLVDISAPHLVGDWLLERDRGLLAQLVESPSLWEQRIAILSTFAFIRMNQYDDTLALADRLLNHPHDLIHKAVGWMLREVGNRDQATEEAFLAHRYQTMPRTMLRYAIEKFPEERRQDYLKGRA